MSDRKFDLDDLRAALITSAGDSGARFKRQLEIDKLGEGIAPRLSNDGLNFHRWSKSLTRLVEQTHGEKSYFLTEDFDDNSERNSEIRTYIEKSIAIDLLNSIEEEDEARKVYHHLRRQFEKHSWSHVMNLLDDLVNAPEASENLHEAFANTKSTISNLKSAIGSTWTDDALTAIFFHLRNKKYYHDISTAMDSRMLSDQGFKIKANEVLQVAQRFQKRIVTNNPSNSISLMAASGSRDQGNNNQNPNFKSKPPANRIPLNQQSESWAKYHLSPRFPCLHCFEWGHWAQDCKRKKMGLPAIDDPRKKDPKVILKKSAVVSHPCIAEVDANEEDPFISSIQETTENEALVLLDSGATHHVTGNINLFKDYQQVDLSLSVASAKRHPVVGKGTISLECQSGRLVLTDVLHCPVIPGTIISLGKFMKSDGLVNFEEGIFKLKQNDCTHCSLVKSDRWYLSLSSIVECSEVSQYNKDVSCLLHRRLAHVSLRTVRRMQRLNSVKGLPSGSVIYDVNLCRSCLLAKSKHLPINAASRLIVNEPGDVIVADLMGPFPVSFDKKVYALIVQDHFSSLATFYPLQQKSQAAQLVIEWINKFNNLTKFKVKQLRTDNGGEFSSCLLNDTLRERGIVHETIIPYEHHQAGKIERTNRTIAEAARSMLIDSNVNLELWPYAFRQAVWVFNRVLHGKASKTPYELVTGKTPDLTPLKVFGCKAYVHNALHRKDLSPKARELIYLGVAEDSKGWVFWNIEQKTIVRGASAVFDERSGLSTSGVTPAANTIQITNLFDTSMIQEVDYQDQSFELMNLTATLDGESPRTYYEAMDNPDSKAWQEAMQTEPESIDNMAVWEECDVLPGQHILGTRWVFTLKRNSSGDVVRYKARIVVQGHRQIKASNLHWEVQTFDVATAYLHSKLDESIYVRLPPGHPLRPGRALKLNKALYGLKQAGRCWWQHLQNVLSEIGFRSNQEDQSTYIYKNGEDHALLWIHVDDGLLGASTMTLMEDLKVKLSRKLLLKWDLGIHSIVGIGVRRVGNTFYLSQSALAKKISESHPSNITAEQPLPDLNLESGKATKLDKEYLSRIGMLLYLAQATRPDIMFLVNYLARFSMNTTRKHWAALEYLINYVRGTQINSLKIEADNNKEAMEMYVDANWGGEASRSQHGFIGFLWGSPVTWNSRRQTCVASSTCQAEYMALSFAARAGIWLSQAINTVFDGIVPTLISDNKAAIQIASDSGSRKNSRHIQREFHLINELLTTKRVTISWIKSEDQKADIFTKRLGKLKIKRFNEDIFNG
ncbi:hypothetical protein O181_079148 [Austropuccinia psidii MF-1]|uniref:Integrase catalytic domain-containing protein n=1 Tax=Austropuccinia psidii MF-1 TaxID=1389203 RepID=A0A9Q3FG55_9BASI|nr:hypothetical protein [Austropuccinia psidii MF-1]